MAPFEDQHFFYYMTTGPIFHKILNIHPRWHKNSQGNSRLNHQNRKTTKIRTCAVSTTCIHHKQQHDIIKWNHFLCCWPFVWGFPRSPVNSPHKGQWHGALMFSLICAWINGWVNSGKAGDLRRHRAHYDVTVMRTDVQLIGPWEMQL